MVYFLPDTSLILGLVHPVTRQKQLQEIIALDHVDDEVNFDLFNLFVVFEPVTLYVRWESRGI